MIDWNIWKESYKPNVNRYIANENPNKVSISIDEFDLPIQTTGFNEIELKFPSGTVFNVCPHSDFFIDIKDFNKQRFWNMMKIRYDCIFVLNTRNIHYLKDGLSLNLGEGLHNIIVSITINTQKELNHISVLAKSLPLKHLWINFVSLKEKISLENCHKGIECIYSSGDELGKSITDFTWHSYLAKQCQEFGIGYAFLSTGRLFKVGEKIYDISPSKRQEQALRAGINVSKFVDKKSYIGKPVEIGGMLWKVFNNILVPVDRTTMEIRYDLICQSKQFINCGNFKEI